MGLLKIEQETVINFNAAEETCSIYSADPAFMRKLDKLCVSNPGHFKQTRDSKVKGKVVGKFYECPKRFISLRTKDVKREMTEDAKKAFAERMRKTRANTTASKL